MNEKFHVPFETAKLLKEKGYNESNDYVYDRCANDGKECIEIKNVDFEYQFNSTNSDIDADIEFTSNICTAPTYHEVVDWLEREKEIYITTYRVVMAYVVETPQGTIKEKLGWKGCAEVPSGAEEDTDTFITREEALNAGILKALEML